MVLQRKYWIALLAVAAMLLLGAVISGVVQSVWGAKPVLAAEDEQNLRTITVTGSGEVEVEPDVAYITFGVTTKAVTANEAQEANAKIFENVQKALVDTFKIKESDIKTTSFNVHPEYRYAEKEEPKITGYNATNMVQVTYRELDRIGELLDAVSKAGVNQVNNVRFASEKAEEHELEAMKEAMANARKKAEVIAAAENKQIKAMVHASQSGGFSGGPVFGDSFAGVALKEMAAADGASTSISGGSITVRTTVTVQYEF